MEKRDFTITAETGIHARPATILVQPEVNHGCNVTWGGPKRQRYYHRKRR